MSVQLEGSPSACGQSVGPAVLGSHAASARAADQEQGWAWSRMLQSVAAGLRLCGAVSCWWQHFRMVSVVGEAGGQVRSGFTLSFSVENWACSKHWQVVSSWLWYL